MIKMIKKFINNYLVNTNELFSKINARFNKFLQDLYHIFAVMLKDLSVNLERKSLEINEKSNIKNYSSEIMPVESIEYSEKSKCYTIRFKFENTLRGREFFYVLWNSMNNLVIWDFYTEKHFNVAVTTTHIIEKRRNIYALHRFARVNAETTFTEYFNQIWNTSKLFWEAYNYESDRFDLVQIT